MVDVVNKTKELFKKHKEIISYLFWGVLTTVVSWVSFAAASKLLESFGWDVILLSSVANAVSIVLAVSFAFVTNKLWVFDSKSWDGGTVLPELARFLSARFVTALLEMGGVPALVALGLDTTFFGIEGMIAKAVVSVAVVILNYVFSKLFVFKERK